jgi:uncharacterized membrane protein YdjX (TVP38/TMEM64 family)
MNVRPKARIAGLALLVVVAFGIALVLVPHSALGLRHMVASAGPIAPLALLAGWTLLTPALFPGAALAAATGLVLGPKLGIPLALVGATSGATAAFLLARHTAASASRQLASPRIRSLQARVERRAVPGIAAIRAAPAVPAGLLNYAAGLSRVRTRDFVVGITLGGAPRVVAYAALGGGLSHAGPPAAIGATLGVAALSAIAAVTAVALLARRSAPSAG